MKKIRLSASRTKFLQQIFFPLIVAMAYFPSVDAVEPGTVTSLSEEDFLAEIPVALTATQLAHPITEAPVAIMIIDREMIEIIPGHRVK